MSTGALLTVISGTPGAGKTALAVSMLQQEREKNPDRPVLVMGIPDLAIPHEPVPPVGEWTVEKTHPDDPTITYPEFVFPEGAIVIIDEAQNAFRPRSQGSKVPPHVAAMERHRHRGLDFWLITQHPTMLDSNIRKLCGKHLHVRSHWAGGQLLEWSEAADPNSVAERGKATTRRYAPPKKVFGLYKSSSMHVKRSRRLPLAVYLFLVVVAVAVVLGYRFFDRVSTAINGTPVQAAASGAPAWANPGAAGMPLQGAQGAPVAFANGATVEDYVPRIPTRPETAPLYDGLRQVRALPTVAGCVAMGDRCQCYTDQGTDAFLTGDQCREWLRKPAFNPWLERRQESVRQSVALPQSVPVDRASGVVIADGGTYGGIAPLGR